MTTKVSVVLAGGPIAALLLARYVALSRSGLPMRWMPYLGLPITASGVLFALRLINLGPVWAPGPTACRRPRRRNPSGCGSSTIRTPRDKRFSRRTPLITGRGAASPGPSAGR